MTRFTLQGVLLLIGLCVLASGCGTIVALQKDVRDRPYPGRLVYAGVRESWAMWEEASAVPGGGGIQAECQECLNTCMFPFFAVDLAASAVGDTLILPYSLPHDIHQRKKAERAQDEYLQRYAARTNSPALSSPPRPVTPQAPAPVPASPPATGEPAWRVMFPLEETGRSFQGEWLAQFEFRRNSANSSEKPHPWLAFDVTLQQEGNNVKGSMAGRGYHVLGEIRGTITNGSFAGTMRLSWDNHDWERLVLALTPDSASGDGQAVFRANTKEQHFYSIKLRRKGIREPY